MVDPKHPHTHTQFLRYSLLIIGIIAVFINAFVLLLVHRMRDDIARLSHQLVAVISIVDLLSGLNSVISFLVMEYLGVKSSFESSVYCSIFGFAGNMTIILSGLLMAALVIERYVLVCHEKLMSTVFTFCWVSVLMVLVTIPSLATSLRRQLTHDPIYAYCVVKGDAWASFTNILTTPMFIFPLFVVIFCYLAILRRVSYISKVSSHTLNSPAKQRGINAARRMVTIKSALFIILYSACFLPKIVTLICSYLEVAYNIVLVTNIMNILSPIGINLLNCVNPVLILLLHTQFKQAAIDLVSSRSYFTAFSEPILP